MLTARRVNEGSGRKLAADGMLTNKIGGPTNQFICIPFFSWLFITHKKLFPEALSLSHEALF